VNNFTVVDSYVVDFGGRFDVDVQLKCFHHEDQLMKTNWPASVSVSVNNMPLAIDRGDGRNQRPVFLKRVIQPGHNMLQIAVSNCCCVSTRRVSVTCIAVFGQLRMTCTKCGLFCNER
jgi:hypothetical protein